MTTLDPALDKLRSKQLSFGCIIEQKYGERRDEHSEVVFPQLVVVGKFEKYYQVFDYSEIVRGGMLEKEIITDYNILGHPLTRGRICHVYHGEKKAELCIECKEYNSRLGGELYRCYMNIEDIMYYVGFDKTEIERQQHPKRPELRELLIKFAEYI